MFMCLIYSCCEASSAVVPSCTNPLTQTRNSDQKDLCPRPPQLSIDDVQDNINGKLDSENVFVDEALLRKGNELDPEVYIRKIQAGFVLSHRDPPYSVCGCSDIEYFTQEYIDQLTECTTVSGAQLYALNQDSMFAGDLEWLSRDCNDSNVVSGSGSGDMLFNGDYTVDGVSANILQLLACVNESFHDGCDGESRNNRPVAEYYPNQTSQISATIFYNNNVPISIVLCVGVTMHAHLFLFSSHGTCLQHH